MREKQDRVIQHSADFSADDADVHKFFDALAKCHEPFFDHESAKTRKYTSFLSCFRDFVIHKQQILRNFFIFICDICG